MPDHKNKSAPVVAAAVAILVLVLALTALLLTTGWGEWLPGPLFTVLGGVGIALLFVVLLIALRSKRKS